MQLAFAPNLCEETECELVYFSLVAYRAVGKNHVEMKVLVEEDPKTVKPKEVRSPATRSIVRLRFSPGSTLMLSVFACANPVRKIVRLNMINRHSGFLKCPCVFPFLLG